jgi:ubiquinone/menaquinone biosynthesis C-methylase UbiE
MTTSPARHHDHAPNHHAHHHPFTGFRGLVGALAMAGGRSRDGELALELTGAVAGDRVVDIGAGPGGAARVAAAHGATVTAVDPARVMRRVGRLLTRSSRVRYVDGTAEALPLPDASADVVWSIATVHHWQDIDTGLAECARVLRAGGRFAFVERQVGPDAHGLASHGWTRDQADALAERCVAAGFVDVAVVEGESQRGPVWAVTGAGPN